MKLHQRINTHVGYVVRFLVSCPLFCVFPFFLLYSASLWMESGQESTIKDWKLSSCFYETIILKLDTVAFYLFFSLLFICLFVLSPSVCSTSLTISPSYMQFSSLSAVYLCIWCEIVRQSHWPLHSVCYWEGDWREQVQLIRAQCERVVLYTAARTVWLCLPPERGVHKILAAVKGF